MQFPKFFWAGIEKHGILKGTACHLYGLWSIFEQVKFDINKQLFLIFKSLKFIMHILLRTSLFIYVLCFWSISFDLYERPYKILMYSIEDILGFPLIFHVFRWPPKRQEISKKFIGKVVFSQFSGGYADFRKLLPYQFC